MLVAIGDKPKERDVKRWETSDMLKERLCVTIPRMMSPLSAEINCCRWVLRDCSDLSALLGLDTILPRFPQDLPSLKQECGTLNSSLLPCVSCS